MNLIHFLARSLKKAVLTSTVVLTIPTLAVAGDAGPVYSFDFADSFYRANGIEPTALIERVSGADGRSVVDNSNTDPTRRNVRDLRTAVTYDHSGHLYFLHVLGLMTPDSFTKNEAGARGYEIAEEYNLYAFPRKSNSGNQVFPKRQENLADLRNSYFSNNPLGLGKVHVVRYTDTALNTAEGQVMLAALAARNGNDADGTPIIRTLGDLDTLRSAGYVTVTPVPPDAQGVAPWCVCPVIKDPRDGAIAPDSFLGVVKGADGSLIPESQRILKEFNCLKNTGDFCD